MMNLNPTVELADAMSKPRINSARRTGALEATCASKLPETIWLRLRRAESIRG